MSIWYIGATNQQFIDSLLSKLFLNERTYEITSNLPVQGLCLLASIRIQTWDPPNTSQMFLPRTKPPELYMYMYKDIYELTLYLPVQVPGSYVLDAHER